MNAKMVLIVDDDPNLCDNLTDILQDKGYEPFTATTYAAGLKLAIERRPELALLDLKLPDGQGTELLSELKQLYPDCICIIMTAYADLDSAITALTEDAYRYLQKPVHPAELLGVLAGAFETIQLREQKRQAQKALKESEKKYRLLLKNLPSIVYRGFKDWSIEFVDNKVELLTGYHPNAFNSKQMKWSDLIVKEDFEAAKKCFIQALKTDKSYVREYRIKTKAEDIIWIQERGEIICNNKEKIEYVSGVFFDITDKRRVEQQLIRADRLSSLGLLSGGIAHEIRNPLAGINLFVDILCDKYKFEQTEKELKILGEVKENVGKIESIIKRVLDYAKPITTSVEKVDVNSLVRENLKFWTTKIRELKIKYELVLEEDLPKIRGDAVELNQVINNLVLNSIETMESGGTLDITTYRGPSSFHKDRQVAVLNVKDTGSGIQPQHRESVFDPFFTTKSMGTGLGLAITHQIIERHGGVISFQSEPNQGTTFTVELPAIAART